LPISQKQKPSWEKRGSSTALPPPPLVVVIMVSIQEVALFVLKYLHEEGFEQSSIVFQAEASHLIGSIKSKVSSA
jgi:hypothetical protein